MRTDRPAVNRLACAALAAGLLLLSLVLVPQAPADPPRNANIPEPPRVFDKAVPEDLGDLKAIQEHVKKVTDQVIACTVGLRIGGASGSGVIITEDGYVLTAGHVSGKPGQNVVVILPGGKQVKGKTLGANHKIDSGLVKITDEGKYPFLDMGKSAELKKGQWCIAIGHPGGYKEGRAPVVRLGRILENGKGAIRTDCTLVGGDSGGPLFDMTGKVIGINSRIALPITMNIHVPVDTYRDTWDNLAKAEELGKMFPYVGLQADPVAKDCKIGTVAPGSPAEKAGLKVNDVVTKFAGQKIDNYDALVETILKRRVGEQVVMEVQRGDQTVTLNLTIGKRPD